MSTDPTNYHRPLEPTQAVHNNPYAPTSPYDEIPMPPPPPKDGVLLKIVIPGLIIVLIIAIPIKLGIVISSNSQNTPGQQYGQQFVPLGNTAAVTQIETASVEVTTPTLMINPNYAADDIYNDMLENNLPINSHYENAEFNRQDTAWGNIDVAWQPTSGMLLNDASLGFGDSWPIGLYVFASKDQAYEDAQAVKANASQVDFSTHGRCLLVAASGITDFSRYVAIVTQYCI